MPGRVLFLAALLLGGCPSAETGLLVDLRSDFVPGVEVARARTGVTVEGRVVGMDDVSLAGADLLRGERIAEVSPLPPGSYLIVVDLITPAGTILFTRRVRVDHRTSTALTVVATRDCEGRACPGPADPADATECFGGRCVPSGCAMLGEVGCPPVLCAGDGDCPPPVAACAAARCRDGVCFAEGRMGACGRDAVCVPDRGCVDLGPTPDAGTDAGGTDAGHDAGPPTCAGGCDDGNGCTDDACVSGSCRHTPNGAGCDDGNACTHSDHCSGGGCSGTGYGCAPMDCMTASCDGSGGCSYSGGCGSGSTCSGGSCVPCGAPDQICCTGGGCNPGLWCYTGVCTCGQRGGPCCPWDMGCDMGTVCGGGTCCVPYGGSCAAGGPCCDPVPCRSGICFD
jgi:hypothetical protein